MRTPNFEKENRHRAAHTTRPKRRKSSSVSGADVGWIPTAGKNCVLVATDFPTTTTTRSWRASTEPVASASGPAGSSASIMTMRPTRCAACFATTATRRSDFSRTTRTSRTQPRRGSSSRSAMGKRRSGLFRAIFSRGLDVGLALGDAIETGTHHRFAGETPGSDLATIASLSIHWGRVSSRPSSTPRPSSGEQGPPGRQLVEATPVSCCAAV